MEQSAHKQIVNILKENDHKGIAFAMTKKELLRRGFTEAQITRAVYEFSYDGKPSPEINPDPLHEHYNNDPETTREIANSILKDSAQHKKTEMIADGMASQFAPGRHAQTHHEYRFFSELGISWWGLFFLVIVIFAGLIYFDFSTDTIEFVFGILGFVIGIYIVYKFFKAMKS